MANKGYTIEPEDKLHTWHAAKNINGEPMRYEFNVSEKCFLLRNQDQ